MGIYQYQIKIDGMTCQHCVERVRQAIEQIDSVLRVEVDLDSGTSQVEAARFDLSERLGQAIEDLPYTNRPESVDAEIELPVHGMSCQKCVAKARQALCAVPGVRHVEVNLETASARIEGNYLLTDLLTAIESAGFFLAPPFRLNVRIGGMSCQKCVARVDAALRAITGVTDVLVNLEEATAGLNGDVSLEQVHMAVVAAGYEVLGADDPAAGEGAGEGPAEPAMAESILPEITVAPDLPRTQERTQIALAVTGMTCAACVASVERALIQSPGVLSASVNFADRSALVTTNGSRQDLLRAIEDAGYGASVIEDENNLDERDRLITAEFRTSLKRSGIALVIGALLMAGTMGGILPGLEATLPWLLISAFMLGAMIFAGGHFYRGAWKSVATGSFNMDVLIALGTGTAWVYSTLLVLLPDLVPEAFRHQYFEAAILIIGFVNLGGALELRARGKTSQAIRKLLGLQARDAIVLRDGKETILPIAEIVVGDLVLVRPGQQVPVDGIVIEGAGHVDESMLTGEPIAVSKAAGDEVIGGTLNQLGSLQLRATRVGSDTALARIISLVREAQNSKPAIGRLTDKIAAVFVPLVLVIAVITGLSWYLFGPAPQLPFMLITTMSVLIIACPCALGLATPMSIMVGVGRAASCGILIRNGEALQTASQIDTLVFDKTGTLTTGKPSVAAIKTQGMSEEDLLALTAAVERHSEHPLAQAILNAARDRGIEIASADDVIVEPGGGITGIVSGRALRIGNQAFMTSGKLDTYRFQESADDQAGRGATPVFVGCDGDVVGLIAIADPVRKDSREAIARLRAMGIRTLMLTGDHQLTADAVAAELGIDEVIASVKPAEKATRIAALKREGCIVAMVGDGINDSPALATADIGFAMGTGTDIAIESADIALMQGSIAGVADAIGISKLTMRNIYQNLSGAFLYNILCIPIAAGILYPMFGLLLSPVLAGAAMAASSVTVVGNANRLRLQSY